MNENETNDVDTPASISKSQPQKSRQMPGNQLATYRHAQGRSIEEIANLLKLTPRQILALEADDYALWPALATVRGFIRAYAKILKVDPAPLIAMVAPEPVEPVTPMASPRTLSTPLLDLRRLPSLFINRRNTSLRWVISSVVFLLVIVFFVQHGVGGIAQTFGIAFAKVADFGKEWTSFASSAFASSSPSSSVDAASASESLQLAPADALVSLKKNVVDSEAASKSFAEGLGENPPENIVKNLVNNLANNAVDNSSKNSLVLKIREDSWIEIRKMNRSGTVVSRLFKAGTSETFNVEEPMFMVVGNPTGVDASFRGVQLEMKRASNSKIARINLK